MDNKGFSGRAGNHANEPDVLAGCYTTDTAKPLPVQRCANPDCDKPFRPRAEGEIYCRDKCDTENYKGWKFDD